MHRIRLLLATSTALLVTLMAVGFALPVPAGAQDGSGVTTTSEVIDNRELGHIIQRPNAGKPPESPTDPGGWLQVSLFFLICGAIILLVGFVAWRSKVLRERRKEAGLDPVDLAKRTGEGVRHEPTHPPTPVDD